MTTEEDMMSVSPTPPPFTNEQMAVIEEIAEEKARQQVASLLGYWLNQMEEHKVPRMAGGRRLLGALVASGLNRFGKHDT